MTEQASTAEIKERLDMLRNHLRILQSLSASGPVLDIVKQAISEVEDMLERRQPKREDAVSTKSQSA